MVIPKSYFCTGNTGRNGHASGAASTAMPRSSLPDQLQAAPAQVPVQQPARRGPGQGSAHRPVIGGMYFYCCLCTSAKLRLGAA